MDKQLSGPLCTLSDISNIHSALILFCSCLRDAMTPAEGCKQFVKAPFSVLPATHDLMAVVMRDLFQLFKYNSCCQGDKDIIVLQFSKDRRRFWRQASEGYNMHTHTHKHSGLNRACSPFLRRMFCNHRLIELQQTCLLLCSGNQSYLVSSYAGDRGS